MTNARGFSSLTLLAIVAVLLIAGGAYYLYSGNAGGWKEYSNNTYHFTLSVPADQPALFSEIQNNDFGSIIVINGIPGSSSRLVDVTTYSETHPVLTVALLGPSSPPLLGYLNTPPLITISTSTVSHDDYQLDLYFSSVPPEDSATYTQLLNQIIATVKFTD